ncbi:MAG: restriction endonuclease subunit S [Rubrivivax sp.]
MKEAALPAGWTFATLSEIGEWRGGGTPSKSRREFWESGDIPWVSPKDMKRLTINSAKNQITEHALAESAASLVPTNSVLMVTRSGILQHTFPVAVNSVPVAINQDLKAWTPKGMDSLYAAYYLRAKQQEVLASCSKDGTTVSSIEFERLRRFPMPIAPQHEQQRIVSRIEELFSKLDEGERALERVQTLVARYRQSVLKAAVTGELTHGWRARHASEPSQSAGDDSTTSLPAGWAWTTVVRAGEVRLGRQRAPQHHQGEHMRPYLRVANVYEDRLDLTDVKEMNFTPKEFETYTLKPGDILLNEGQSPELVGRPAMYRGEVPGCCYQKTLLRFRARPGVLPDFALLVFRHYLHSGRFRRSANITTSIAHLAAERFEPIEFPLPPQAEQAAIVDAASEMLERLAHLEAELRAQRQASASLRQSVLNAAFSGRLVPQDATDEPASALLARLAAQAAETAPAPRRRARR